MRNDSPKESLICQICDADNVFYQAGAIWFKAWFKAPKERYNKTMTFNHRKYQVLKSRKDDTQNDKFQAPKINTKPSPQSPEGTIYHNDGFQPIEENTKKTSVPKGRHNFTNQPKPTT